MTKLYKADISIPKEAGKRGSLVTGMLTAANGFEMQCLLVQFSEIGPSSRSGRIFFYTDHEQAKRLYGLTGPLNFTGTLAAGEGEMTTFTANDIWPKSGKQMPRHEAVYWTQSSGRIGQLTTQNVKTSQQDENQQDFASFAWFVVSPCFVLQILANSEENERKQVVSSEVKQQKTRFTLPDGATAEVKYHLQSHQLGPLQEVKQRGFSIHVRGFTDSEKTKEEIDAFLLLASFASRERTVTWHWNTQSRKGELNRHWRFNFRKFRRRDDREEPLLLRDRYECAEFMKRALGVYSKSGNKERLSSAVYALLAENLPMELRIARLFFGIEGALMFAMQIQGSKLPDIGPVFREFARSRPRDFSDLWPLFTAKHGYSLSQIRNAIVHGEAFAESSFLALSYAAEHLQWYLERIILIALGWDIDRSAVSPQALKNYCAYEWQLALQTSSISLRR